MDSTHTLEVEQKKPIPKNCGEREPKNPFFLVEKKRPVFSGAIYIYISAIREGPSAQSMSSWVVMMGDEVDFRRHPISARRNKD